MTDSVPTVVTVTTVGGCSARVAAQWSDSGVVLPDERVTYPELDARINEYARSLLSPNQRGQELHDTAHVDVDDRRLTDQAEYLTGATLHWRTWETSRTRLGP